MDRKLILIIAIIAFLISLVGLMVSMFSSPYLEKKTYYASLSVGEFFGFDVNSTAVTFGTVMPGGSSKRSLNVTNSYNFSVFVQIIPYGEVSRFVARSNATLETGESRLMPLEAYVPEGMAYGEYNGEIVVLIKKVN